VNKSKLILILSTLCLYELAWSTPQIPEKIIINGKKHKLLSTPLEPLRRDSSSINLPYFPKYFADSDSTYLTSSGNWRGYIATWKIENDSLFLVKIEDYNSDKTADLSDIFNEQYINGKVMASWYTGDLRVADGALLNYIHMGFMSTYEKETVIEVERGIIISIQKYDNRRKDPPRGYVRMMTLNLTADIPKSLHACHDPISDTLCLSDDKGELNIYGFTIQDFQNRLDKPARKDFVAAKMDSCAQSYAGHFTFGEPSLENQRYGYVGWADGAAVDGGGMMRIVVMSNLYSRLFVFILMKGSDREYFDKVTDVFCHSLVFMEFGY
jgi:hypothetical protein